MVIFRAGATGQTRRSGQTRRTDRSRRTVLTAAGGAALLGLLTACGSGAGSTATAPQTLPGTARPASAGSGGSSAPGTAGATSSAAPGAVASASKSAGTRCHTSELGASVGSNDPGAGQENFPLVLTNRSGRTCTLHGYPGAAFVDAAGVQLGPDPDRSSGSTATTVTLAPGASAWAGLSFSNPQISGAKARTPAAILITPPDETTFLKVTWSQGEVPVSGNSSTAHLTVLRAGTGS